MQPSLQTDAQIAENTSNAPNVNTLKFDDLNLARPILSALKSAGYITPTPIQAQAIPAAMSGRDLLLSARTGSWQNSGVCIAHFAQIIKQREHRSPCQQACYGGDFDAHA